MDARELATALTTNEEEEIHSVPAAAVDPKRARDVRPRLLLTTVTDTEPEEGWLTPTTLDTMGGRLQT